MKLESLLVATIGLLGLVSCEKSESLITVLPEDEVIRVSAGVDDPSTRAGALTSNLTEFGMFVKSPNASYSYNNVKANKVSNEWTTSKEMLWNNETDAVEIVAYAPYMPTFSNLTTARTISVLADQSTEDKVIASDFLYAKSSVCPSAPNVNNPIHYNATEKKVEAKLNHHFSKLLLTITINGEFHGVSNVGTTNPISNLVIMGTNTSTTLTLENGAITSLTNPSPITPFAGAYEGLSGANDIGSAKYEAIIIPQNVNTLSIEFMIDGKEYVWTASDVDFVSGKSRTLELTVGELGVVEASYKVGDVYPKDAVGNDIVGVVWMVKGADGNANLTAGAEGTSGSIVALRDIKEGGNSKWFQWATRDREANYEGLYMDINLENPTRWSNGQACQAYVLDYLAGRVQTENGYKQTVDNSKNYTLDDFPAIKACIEYTDGDALTTWYLPAVDQLFKHEFRDVTASPCVSGIYYELTRSSSPLADAIGEIGDNTGSVNTGSVTGAQSFTDLYYWSSTEHNENHSNLTIFRSPSAGWNFKSTKAYVRCVRDF